MVNCTHLIFITCGLASHNVMSLILNLDITTFPESVQQVGKYTAEALIGDNMETVEGPITNRGKGPDLSITDLHGFLVEEVRMMKEFSALPSLVTVSIRENGPGLIQILEGVSISIESSGCARTKKILTFRYVIPKRIEVSQTGIYGIGAFEAIPIPAQGIATDQQWYQLVETDITALTLLRSKPAFRFIKEIDDSFGRSQSHRAPVAELGPEAAPIIINFEKIIRGRGIFFSFDRLPRENVFLSITGVTGNGAWEIIIRNGLRCATERTIWVPEGATSGHMKHENPHKRIAISKEDCSIWMKDATSVMLASGICPDTEIKPSKFTWEVISFVEEIVCSQEAFNKMAWEKYYYKPQLPESEAPNSVRSDDLTESIHQQDQACAMQ